MKTKEGRSYQVDDFIDNAWIPWSLQASTHLASVQCFTLFSSSPCLSLN